MRIAETVTFGGSALDRAFELRRDPAVLLRAVEEGGADCILLWRGKPLVRENGLETLVRLPLDHPVLARCAAEPVLLGREEGGRLCFAQDISGWQPELEPQALGGFLDVSEQRHPDLPPGAVFAELRRIMTRLSARDAEIAATARALYGWHDTHRHCARCGAESDVSLAGWQRRCGACGAQHFPRTDPVVIMLILHGNSVLLGRSPGWPEKMYSLLAGFVEPGETLEAAVRREVLEETRIRIGPVRYLASQPWPFPTSLMVGCIGRAETRDITIDPDEIEDALWVTREEMLEAFAGRHPALLPARTGAIAHFLLRNWLADRLD